MKLLTLTALLATATTLQGCDFGRHSPAEAFFTVMGAPLPVTPDDAAAPVAAAIVAAEPLPEQQAAVVGPPVESVPEPVAPPPPPQYGEPGYVAAYMQKGYTGPEPCPGSVFRVLTCDDDGVSWHWLGPNMEWLQ